VVEARNDLGSVWRNLTVVVDYNITEISVTVPPVMLTMVTNTSVTVVHGGQDFRAAQDGHDFIIHVDFGDDHSARLWSLADTTQKSSVHYPNFDMWVHKVYVGHLYAGAGEYQLLVNVSNKVACQVARQVAVVKEVFARVYLETDSPRTVATADQPVVVTAHVESDDEYSFTWDFSDQYPTSVHR
jgi:hypothetical protein